MTARLKFPQWQEPLAVAILETDPKRFEEKLHEVIKLIDKRLDELKADTRADEEYRALHDGLSILRRLRKGGNPV